MQKVRMIFQLLSTSGRKQALVVLILALFVGVFDALGIASIMPFIAVLSNPEIINENEYLSYAYRALQSYGLQTTNQFVFCLGVFVFAFLVFSLFKAFATFSKHDLLRCKNIPSASGLSLDICVNHIAGFWAGTVQI